jgi:hypothetical protein
VLFLAIVDILVNIFFLFSIYMSRRDGSYIRYLWQWNAFHLARIATSALVLYSVIKVSLRDLIIAAVLNGAIFGCLLYAVSIAKFAYNNCERSLCKFSDSCSKCEHQNYHDYDLTSKWSRKFSLFHGLEPLYIEFIAVFTAFQLIAVIVYAVLSTRKEPRQSAFATRNTEIF